MTIGIVAVVALVLILLIISADPAHHQIAHARPVMLTTAEIQAELRRVTYQPGWSIHVYDGRHEGQHAVITTEVPDAYHLGQTITLDIHSPLPPIPDADYLHAWMVWRLTRIASHEVREFYRVGGKSVFDPHAEYADRDRE